ncbi:unnamed protein product [Urochloa humidicola]
MLCLSPAAAAFWPAARGAIASQQQQRQGLPFPHPSIISSAAAAFRPADPAARGAMASPQQQQPLRVREFDHFVVIDFEATCEKGTRIYPQEIIEFPAVLVDAATGDLLSAFRTYVKPRYHPRLTEFCSELTGIQQDQVDGGVELAQALDMHDAWLAAVGVTKNRLAVVTWGDWDCRTMLESECNFKNLSKPTYFDRWVNLRIPFETELGAGRRNLQEAVREAGLQWDGRLHCGLDDARNTARLLVELMRRGVTISITDSLAPPPLPEPESKTELHLHSQPAHLQSQPALANHNFCVCGAAATDYRRLAVVNHNFCVGGAATTDYRCFCGVPIRGDLVTMPGPMQGRCFFGCGNWTPTMGPMCSFFLWAA